MERTLVPEFTIELKALLEAINLRYDFDFREYSINSITRSVVHAMNRMGCDNLKSFQEKILREADSFYDLLQSLTIPVSEMFRDPSYFLSLREKVVPILKTYPSINVWVAGCGTGEEVYSLAILLQEENLLERTTIFATDINSRTLNRAAAGSFDIKIFQYNEGSYKESGGLYSLSTYYTKPNGMAVVNENLKKNITFADHSLATDNVFSEMHFISCRNVLIYFNRDLQNKVIGLFNQSLHRKGFLGLGSKETIQFSENAKHYDPFVIKDRIYQKK